MSMTTVASSVLYASVLPPDLVLFCMEAAGIEPAAWNILSGQPIPSPSLPSVRSMHPSGQPQLLEKIRKPVGSPVHAESHSRSTPVVRVLCLTPSRTPSRAVALPHLGMAPHDQVSLPILNDNVGREVRQNWKLSATVRSSASRSSAVSRQACVDTM